MLCISPEVSLVSGMNFPFWFTIARSFTPIIETLDL